MTGIKPFALSLSKGAPPGRPLVATRAHRAKQGRTMALRKKVTYKEIARIAHSRGMVRSLRMKLLEGCLRRLMTDILRAKRPLTKKVRDLLEYRLIMVAREVRDMYKA